MDKITLFKAGRLIKLLFIFCMISLPVFGAGTWHIKEAPIRYKIKITWTTWGGRRADRPTQKSCGYFVHLPDKGILPEPLPYPHVVDQSGKEYKSWVLAQNKNEGLALIFEDTGHINEMYVYFTGASKLNAWTPESGMTPSPFLFFSPKTASMAAAKEMAQFGPMKNPLGFWHKRAGIGIGKMSILCDPRGYPPPCSYYKLAYLTCGEEYGSYSLPGLMAYSGRVGGGFKPKPTMKDPNAKARCTSLANVETYINGQRYTLARGYGKPINTPPGLRKLEMFTFVKAENFYDPNKPRQIQDMEQKWVAEIMIKAPPLKDYPPYDYETMRKHKMTSTSELKPESHSRKKGHGRFFVPEDECAKSGHYVVTGVESRDGKPIPLFVPVVVARDYESYQGGREEKTLVYRMNVPSFVNNPKDTEYIWTLDGGIEVKSRDFLWIYPHNAHKQRPISLTVKSGEYSATANYPLIPFVAWYYSGKEKDIGIRATDRRGVVSDLNEPRFLGYLRDGFNNVLKHIPIDQDPTKDWNSAMFLSLSRGYEYGNGRDLLDIMTKRWKYFEGNPKMRPEQKAYLQNIFYHWLCWYAPDKAIEWLERVEEGTKKDLRRKKELQMMRADVYMYQKRDFEEAGKVLDAFQSKAKGASRFDLLADVKRGDLAFFQGDLNKAAEYWGKVQDIVKAQGIETFMEGITPVEWAGQRRQGMKKKVKYSVAAEKDPEAEGDEQVDEWKKVAVVETQLATEVITLLDQGYLKETLQQLGQWELQFPMSKISADCFIQEARLYMRLQNYQRAATILEAYCKNIEASSFLPKAADLLIDCMMRGQIKASERKEILEDLKKKFEFHPLASKIDRLLKGRRR
ncbi:hypothetical protein ACFLS1_04925 [Verrucomicrobiota bacterium]